MRRRHMLLAALFAPALSQWPTRCSTGAETLQKRNTMKRLRILCLHGYHGSATTLRSQMAALVSELDALTEFVCVDAPSLAAGDFGWWHATAQLHTAGAHDAGVGPGAKHYQGWARTRDSIVDIFDKQGPFDGVLGFSQGAALTSILVGLRASNGRAMPDKPLRFDFALMVGGFPVADPQLRKLYDDASSYQLPTLHLIGRSDRVVPPDISQRLASKFPHPWIVEHDGGHVVAATVQVCKDVRQFLQSMVGSKHGQVVANGSC
jgi:pimeloyl-ACP methyl ester carboxylesterase